MNWEDSRLRMLSSKTEHHDGHESRMVPLFPDLKPVLLEVFEKSEEGSECVTSRGQSYSRTFAAPARQS